MPNAYTDNTLASETDGVHLAPERLMPANVTTFVVIFNRRIYYAEFEVLVLTTLISCFAHVHPYAPWVGMNISRLSNLSIATFGTRMSTPE